MKVKLKTAKRFIKDAQNNWMPRDGGFGELFLAGETVDVPEKYLHMMDVDIPSIEPKDFKMHDKQVTTSHTKTVIKKKKVSRKKVQ